MEQWFRSHQHNAAICLPSILLCASSQSCDCYFDFHDLCALWCYLKISKHCNRPTTGSTRFFGKPVCGQHSPKSSLENNTYWRRTSRWIASAGSRGMSQTSENSSILYPKRWWCCGTDSIHHQGLRQQQPRSLYQCVKKNSCRRLLMTRRVIYKIRVRCCYHFHDSRARLYCLYFARRCS